MASVSIHTGILTSPKHAPLSDAALRLWLHGLCWSKEHLTDGFIPSAMLPSLHPKAARVVGELTATPIHGKSPLWTAHPDGFRIHDFADWQETSAVVQSRRRKWRESKRGTSQPSKVDSTTESAAESRDGSGSGSGRGSGSGGGGGAGTARPPATGATEDPYLADPGAMPTQRRKAHCAWQSSRGLDVPQMLHDELRGKLGGPDADMRLLAWYGATEAEWEGRTVGDTTWEFWRARFREWQGTTVKPLSAAASKVTDGWADGLVAGGAR